MKFLAKDRKDTIVYNNHITISNIPAKAYEYVVNGKSAIEWILERYCVSIDKASGIKNDANDWGKEHQKPRYILDLLLSVINVSVQTVDIVKSLPKLSFGDDKESSDGNNSTEKVSNTSVTPEQTHGDRNDGGKVLPQNERRRRFRPQLHGEILDGNVWLFRRDRRGGICRFR